MIPLKTIEELIYKHSSIEKELSSGSIDKKTFAEKSKEYSDLNEIIDNANKQTRKIHDAIIVRLILIYLSELKSLFIIPMEDYIQSL